MLCVYDGEAWMPVGGRQSDKSFALPSSTVFNRADLLGNYLRDSFIPEPNVDFNSIKRFSVNSEVRISEGLQHICRGHLGKFSPGIKPVPDPGV